MSNVKRIVFELEDGSKVELDTANILQVEQEWQAFGVDPWTKVTLQFKGRPYLAAGPVGDWAFEWGADES